MSFLGLDDQIAHAELLNEGHNLLLRSGTDGKHGDYRGHAKNHAQHGEQGTQFVVGKILETEKKIGQPLREGSWLGQGRSIHWRGNRLMASLAPQLGLSHWRL